MEYKIGIKLKRVGASTEGFIDVIGEVRTITDIRQSGDIILDTGFCREPAYIDRFFVLAKAIHIGGE